MNAGEFDLLVLLPRIAQLSTVLNRSDLIERAVETAGVDLDRPTVGVLLALHMAGEPLRIGEIAKRLQVVGPHITRQVHELERRGLARRIPDPDDQRARRVELTTDGATAISRYLETVLGTLGEALADWSPADRQTFGRLVGRFVDDLTARLSTPD